MKINVVALVLILIFFFFLAGFKRKSGSAGFLDLLLYKLYACLARSRVFGEKIQGYASMSFSFNLDMSIY